MRDDARVFSPLAQGVAARGFAARVSGARVLARTRVARYARRSFFGIRCLSASAEEEDEQDDDQHENDRAQSDVHAVSFSVEVSIEYPSQPARNRVA